MTIPPNSNDVSAGMSAQPILTEIDAEGDQERDRNCSKKRGSDYSVMVIIRV